MIQASSVSKFSMGLRMNMWSPSGSVVMTESFFAGIHRSFAPSRVKMMLSG